jgi:hypothetical protein
MIATPATSHNWEKKKNHAWKKFLSNKKNGNDNRVIWKVFQTRMELFIKGSKQVEMVSEY